MLEFTQCKREEIYSSKAHRVIHHFFVTKTISDNDLNIFITASGQNVTDFSTQNLEHGSNID